MARYAAFLRGVNVGGLNLKMADVAAALTSAGFTSVRTVLASGSALLDAAEPAGTVRRRAETALRERFGYDAWVLVYDVPRLAAIVAAYPFPDAADRQSYVTFVSDRAVLDELAALVPGSGPDERIGRGDGVLYWQVPTGATLDSAVGATMGRPRYKPSTTTRNLRTLHKVLGSR